MSLRASASWRKLRSMVSLQVREQQLLALDRDRAGLDLRQIEDVADEVQQVRAGAVDGLGELDLARRAGSCPHSPPSCWPRIRMLLSGVRSSCDMLARNSDL